MKIGFLAGSFDVLHPGYILMFEDAKAVCDHLVVGLNEGSNVEDPKKLPIILSVEDRKKRLLALRHVDEVITYKTEAELEALLRDLKPDVRILGSDYKDKPFTGMDLDIPVHFHERDHSWSTTKFKTLIAEQVYSRMEQSGSSSGS